MLWILYSRRARSPQRGAGRRNAKRTCGHLAACAARVSPAAMASYFGARDFGDPRHNYVPSVMAYEKATGKTYMQGPSHVAVPALWTPKRFPGQVSYPVMNNDHIPGVHGSHRERDSRTFVSATSARSSSPRNRVSSASLPSPLSHRDYEVFHPKTPTKIRFDMPDPPLPSARKARLRKGAMLAFRAPVLCAPLRAF